MKALLRYGQFTTFVDIPGRKMEIYTMKPLAKLRVSVDGEDLSVTDPPPHKLLFKFHKLLEEDIAEYIFTEEVK